MQNIVRWLLGKHRPKRSPVESKLGYRVDWVLKEWIGGAWVEQVKQKNLVTSYGITALAGAPSGTYTPPLYLVIETTQAALSATYAPGTTSINLATDPTLGTDTQLVLTPGGANQETVTYSLKTGTGPYTFTFTSGTINSHTFADPVVRAPTVGDTISSVIAEAQFDPTYSPGLRLQQTANYSPGAGQNTMQFFISGIQATSLYFAHVGLADTAAIGTGNLHNYSAFGFNHSTTNDVEIDVTWTFIGM